PPTWNGRWRGASPRPPHVPPPERANHLLRLVTAADEQFSRLQHATDRWGDDESFAALMDELRASPAFVERWSIVPTTEKRRGTKRIKHPHLGPLRLNYEVLLLPDDIVGQRLVTWLPADD